MKAWVNVEIEINDNIRKYCGKGCTFLEDLDDHCMLFKVDLCRNIDKDTHHRCADCLEQEWEP